ncbi:Aste57867_9686 [Aphanomyces stellatus]|uniref:Aste57867_9686 protein n=1 Tax=Aphanomyces stellatus TaxID=120398 RepID=A0A485KNH6_9STRA|nr:hypothetical protein As57867_009648 [Aphanomyces stellatus]VFT86565.1 Aste57867_9686 [Aphanomyces stellatus]
MAITPPAFDNQKDLECLLCYDLFKDPVQVDAPCRHHFCRRCIDTWFKQQPECPCDRFACAIYTDADPALVAALSQVEFTCDGCRFQGKWVDHEGCPLVTCSWCPWKSYDDGLINVVPIEEGEMARCHHRMTCPNRPHGANVDRWIGDGSSHGICFGMSVNQVKKRLFGGSHCIDFASLSLDKNVANFECRYFSYVEHDALPLGRSSHILRFWTRHRVRTIRGSFPFLPPRGMSTCGSYCYFYFEKNAGLRLISFRFLEDAAHDAATPNCLAYFTNLFNMALNDDREAVVRANRRCTIYMAHVRDMFLDEPGVLQTFVDFVDPRSVPQNGFNYWPHIHLSN